MKNKGKIIVFLLTAIMAICMLSFSAFAKTINCGNTDKVVVKVVARNQLIFIFPIRFLNDSCFFLSVASA